MHEFVRRQQYIRLDVTDDDGYDGAVLGAKRSPSPTGLSVRSQKRMSGVAFLRSFLPSFTDSTASLAQPAVTCDPISPLLPDAAFADKVLRDSGYGAIFRAGFLPGEPIQGELDTLKRRSRRTSSRRMWSSR